MADSPQIPPGKPVPPQLPGRVLRSASAAEAPTVADPEALRLESRPSPVLQSRLDHALKLYRQKLAPVVVLTGGIGPGDRESEATVGKRYLAARGIPARRIVPVSRWPTFFNWRRKVSSLRQARALRSVRRHGRRSGPASALTAAARPAANRRAGGPACLRAR